MVAPSGARHAANGHRGKQSELAVLFERNLAVVLAEEVEEPLVVASLHVEQPRDDLVVASRFLESPPHDLSHICASYLTIHEQRIYRSPERFVLLDHPLVEIVSNRTPSFALGSKQAKLRLSLAEWAEPQSPKGFEGPRQ